MDQVKVGRFIAECRKAQKWTQVQLADKLGITDKAVSKWECGRSMPDSDLMLDLCGLLNISVNELLSGERIPVENGTENNERLLLDMAKDMEEKDRIIWRSMWVILFVSIAALIEGMLLAEFLIPEGPWQVIALLSLCVIFLIPCFYALKLEISVGAYRCKHCGHEFVPTYREVLWSMHCGTTRRLKCPECHERTMCKKVLKR